jgi:hypothetical protein
MPQVNPFQQTIPKEISISKSDGLFTSFFIAERTLSIPNEDACFLARITPTTTSYCEVVSKEI